MTIRYHCDGEMCHAQGTPIGKARTLPTGWSVAIDEAGTSTIDLCPKCTSERREERQKRVTNHAT